jgi:hypothetical protein
MDDLIWIGNSLYPRWVVFAAPLGALLVVYLVVAAIVQVRRGFKEAIWHARDQARHQGAMAEYKRVVVNGGDLTPLLNAAVDELCGDISEGDRREHRAAIWRRYIAARNLHPSTKRTPE